MSYTENDAVLEGCLSSLLHEHELDKCKQLYKIFLFVEGDTEEAVLPDMIHEAGYDLEENSIEIANYNGVSNLIHSIRLLRKTLNYRSPIIVTIDNDDAGFKEYNRLISQTDLLGSLEPVYFYKLPTSKTKIDYTTHKGGSFEEIFEMDCFLEAILKLEGIPAELIQDKEIIKKDFVRNISWVTQIKKILNSYGYKRDIDKISLGQWMDCIKISIPQDILDLAELIKEVREKYPVKLIGEDFEYPDWLINRSSPASSLVGKKKGTPCSNSPLTKLQKSMTLYGKILTFLRIS
ncbi:MAG: hypothetical protein PF638_04570 [Candidatus Delongbacteria bacterium]|jgi:hypothetical protein|nr:hypothetical protein [Candidatus Delongbacteria bacterium]